MRICVLCQTLDTRTGTGELVSNVIQGAKELLPEAEFSILTADNFLKPGYLSVIRNWSAIRREARESDIIHAFDNYPYGVIATMANLFIGRPLIITAIGTGSLKLFRSSGWKSVLFRWVYSRATTIVAISHYVAGEINHFLPSIHPLIINPGVDSSYWAISAQNDGGKTLGLSKPYILSVGELKTRKGYEKMLPIVSQVLKKIPEFRYVIVASASRNQAERERLQNLIHELGIGERVVFLNDLSKEELRYVYQNATLYFAMPQNVGGDIEGFGMAILQAAAAGVPAVVGSGSGADDAVVDKVSGFLILQDGSVAADKIKSLLSDVSLRQTLSQGAQDYARRMSWQDKAQEYVRIYHRMLHEKA